MPKLMNVCCITWSRHGAYMVEPGVVQHAGHGQTHVGAINSRAEPVAKQVYGAFVPRYSLFFCHFFFLHEVVSLHMCVPPYNTHTPKAVTYHGPTMNLQ